MQFYDDNLESVVSPFGAIALSGAAVGTWFENQISATTPVGASFARILILRYFLGGAGSNPDDAVLLDSVSMELRGAAKEERGDLVDLADTPDSLSGQGGKTLMVNAGGTDVELVTVAAAKQPQIAKAWTTTLTFVPVNSYSKIQWGAKLDPSNAINLAADEWTCPVDGIYKIRWDIPLDLLISSLTLNEILIKIRHVSGGTITTIGDDWGSSYAGTTAQPFAKIMGELLWEFTQGDVCYFDIVNTTTKYGAIYYGRAGGEYNTTIMSFEKAY